MYSDEISVTKLSELRKTVKKDLEEKELKLSYMPFFVKAASNALLKYPIVNSTLLEEEKKICYKSSHNIGVAMDTKNGLAVPVIKNVNNLSIIEIASELNRLMKSGKEGNFTTNDLTGATFSLSNIGIVSIHLSNIYSKLMLELYLQDWRYIYASCNKSSTGSYNSNWCS